MCSIRAHAAGASPSTPARQVLPKSLTPVHYTLRLDPDLPAHKYTGSVVIDVDVKEATQSVSLNTLDLVTPYAELNGVRSTGSSYDSDSQTTTWTFPEPVQVDTRATVKVDFEGTINDHLAGFYRSVHRDEDGNEHIVATTQMEPTDCRRAFPCFDEPALKATFDISIAADKKYTVLSNSDVKSTSSLEDGRVLTEFNSTPKMSTYLVAFVVGELSYVESKLFRLPVRVYATPGLEARCQFSADLAAQTLAFFEDSFGIQYPLPKCDMIGIHDFSAGAMENWGLITYRVVDLFYTEGKDSAATKTRVAEVVQHELAHQWFGNLVTMEWWDGLWLNEGFATWMSWFAGNHFFPSWKVWETYVSQSYQGCLDLDGLRSSHPVQVPVSRADEINQIFDAISYLKGSCIIKMISQYLGEPTFIKGIGAYLRKHAYGNTTTDDLWAALSEASGKDVKGQMDIWTRKIGYPLLTVEELGPNKIRVTQNRYLKTADATAEEDEVLYPVWLGLRGDDGTVDSTKVLTERSAEVEVGEFYKLNADHNGIFRTLYPAERVAKLAEEGLRGNSGRLTNEDRIGLMSDLAALAVGYASSAPVLSLIMSWSKTETDVNVWQTMVQFIYSLQAAYKYEERSLVDGLKDLLAKVAVPKSKELGWQFSPEDSIQSQDLKAALFSAAVESGNAEMVKIALDLYSQGFEAVNPNLRPAVFGAVAKHGTTAQWEELLKLYTDGNHGQAGNNALRALGQTENLDLQKRCLDSLLDGTVRTQDAIFQLATFAHSGDHLNLAWSWIQREWDTILKRFPPSLGLLSNFVRVLGAFTKLEQLAEVEKFFANRDLKGIDQQLRVSKDRIRAANLWLGRSKEEVSEWLAKEL